MAAIQLAYLVTGDSLCKSQFSTSSLHIQLKRKNSMLYAKML